MGDAMLAPRRGDGLSPFMAALASHTRPVTEPIPFPGELGRATGLHYRLRVLTDDEAARARAEALVFIQRYFKALDKDTPPELYMATDQSLYDDELDRQILVRALRSADAPEAAFADIGELRGWLDLDTRKALLASYNAFLDERSPLRKVRTPEELSALIGILGEPRASSRFLASCDTVSLRSIALELGARLIALTRPNSSNSGEPTSPIAT